MTSSPPARRHAGLLRKVRERQRQEVAPASTTKRKTGGAAGGDDRRYSRVVKSAMSSAGRFVSLIPAQGKTEKTTGRACVMRRERIAVVTQWTLPDLRAEFDLSDKGSEKSHHEY